MTNIRTSKTIKGASKSNTQASEGSTMNLVTIGLSTFRTQFGYVEIVKVVRENTNGYPFLTFIDAANEAENVYFSKKAAERVSAGVVVDAQFFSRNEFKFAETTNNQGESRWKIVGKGDSMRLDLDEFED